VDERPGSATGRVMSNHGQVRSLATPPLDARVAVITPEMSGLDDST
jgi:hypothetical protein